MTKIILALAVALSFVAANADTVPYPVHMNVSMSLDCADTNGGASHDALDVVETLSVYNGYGLGQVKMEHSKHPMTAYITLFMHDRALQVKTVVGEGWQAVDGTSHTVYFRSLDQILEPRSTSEVRIGLDVCKVSIKVSNVHH